MKATVRLLAAVALGLPIVSFAGPADYIYTPSVEYGEREIDFKYGTAQFKDESIRESAGSIGFGWGARPWWFTEVYLKYEKNPGDRTKYDAFEWENKFQLTEPNQYPVDVGLITEIEIPREHNVEGYELKIGPLFQADTGPIRWNANLLFERVFSGHSGEPHVTELGYQLQARHDLSSDLGFGVQAFGEVGQWNDWAPGGEQTHRAGPAIFGRIKLGGREQIRYNAAILLKLADGAPDNLFRLQAEYEF